jgi:prepilin-type N-terminal cleavage/methylation domain-containing protein
MLKNRKNIIWHWADSKTTIPHSALRTPHSKGFTLVELIIVIVIISIIAGIAAMIILQGVRAYSDEKQRSNIHYQTRFAVERMEREMRLIRSRTAADIPTMTATSIIFTNIRGEQLGFRLNGGNLERTQDNGATWMLLANGVTALNFTYLQQSGAVAATAATLWYVMVDMTDQQGTEAISIRTRVHPMNFS